VHCRQQLLCIRLELPEPPQEILHSLFVLSVSCSPINTSTLYHQSSELGEPVA
jgi:hypothetical protein